ncbi:MAG: preprotein translocase subunit SecE [candidate division Zixibacteria bacterium]|nr:preprotein translocase subunit SecE [candidate division Zixibacteria bacterium]
MIEKIRTYWSETIGELGKVTWPSRDEIVGSTMVTIVVSLILGFFIFGVDLLLAQGVSTLLGIG